MSAIETRVKQVVAEQLGLKEAEISSEADFSADLGADSLDTVELVMALEEEFEVEVPDEDALGLTNVKATVEYIEKQLKAA